MNRLQSSLVIAALLVSACGGADLTATPIPSALPGATLTPEPPTTTPFPPTPFPTIDFVRLSDAVVEDAKAYAKEYGISLEESVRRSVVMDALSELNAKLVEQEPDTFAGLWLEHEPEFKAVALFTHNGEQTLRPYIEHTVLDGLIEVRSVMVNLAQLVALEREAHQLVNRLGFAGFASTAVDVKHNRVKVHVTDRSLFEARLKESGLLLPEHVEVVAALDTPPAGPPVDVTPVAGVYFAQLVAPSAVSYAILTQGKLLLDDGCLYLGPSARSGQQIRSLIIWQPGYRLNDDQGTIEVWDRDGKVAARVGDEICLGVAPSVVNIDANLREPRPNACRGPFKIASAGVRPTLRQETELVSSDLITDGDRAFYLINQSPLIDGWADTASILTGELALHENDRCLRVRHAGSGGGVLPLWPARYEARFAEDEIEIVDGTGNVIGRVGEHVQLLGGFLDQSGEPERRIRLNDELPCDCMGGDYWLVSD